MKRQITSQMADEKLWRLVQEARASSDPRWKQRCRLVIRQKGSRRAYVNTTMNRLSVTHTLIEEAFSLLGQWTRAFDEDMTTLEDLAAMATASFEQLDPPWVVSLRAAR